MLVNFHGMSSSVTSSDVASSESTLTEEGAAKVVESGSRENVKGRLGRWEGKCNSIWERLREFGLDARTLYHTVEDEEEEQRMEMALRVARDIATVALTTVYYFDLIVEEENQREMPPPTKPLALAEMPIRDF
eukprot:Plantae.Rhodophyta-Palmaria_palmata.ctg5187.p1 GENE.Plantae.Rhodophyta-Palmaria_palmata.ctg5187~~Plantae.Rhodophyta-Palmaria_palmata.ctg5187.p1  ORF type:complete len:133 (+),score=26.87 Plantae.Rhodophyta-Palmaria_palmata.ctg5187:185-583(+)